MRNLGELRPEMLQEAIKALENDSAEPPQAVKDLIARVSNDMGMPGASPEELLTMFTGKRPHER